MILTIGAFLGGLGLFLLAVSMITDGLKLAAGDALRGILARSTSTRLRGVLSGIVVTGIVQSSSAVTVATIGFVNAGLLNLAQALGVVFGTNIGTTMTGWLVAAVGFKIKLEVFAFPMIGLGMAARLFGPVTRAGAIGEAVAGFGLFFISVDVLRDTFEGLAATIDIGAIAPDTVAGVLVYVGVGFVMTVLTQSSSAAIAITLTAAAGGVLAIDAAAAMVIGANVGTTSTAAFAAIGATPNARRVAAAHVAFNVLTAAVALLLLPLVLWVVHATRDALGMTDQPAVTLALFHTVFNVLGVVLVWSWTERLADFLSQRFRTAAEALSKPKHLDANVLFSPTLALDALLLELTRMAELSRAHSTAALSVEGKPPADLAAQHDAIVALIDATEAFVMKLESSRLPVSVAEQVPVVLRITNYLEEVARVTQDSLQHRPDVVALMERPSGDRIAVFQAAVRDVVAGADPALAGFDVGDARARYQALRDDWHDLKSALLDAGARGHLPLARLNTGMESLRDGLRVAEQSTKVAVRLAELAMAVPALASAEDPGAGQPASRQCH